MRAVCFLSIIIMFSGYSFADDWSKREYQVERFSGSQPLIDGILDEEAWQQGTWEGVFTQYEPFNGLEASQKTYFKILFDDNNLFVAIIALDSSPDSIVARLTRRDQEDGDVVAIAFDSFFDQRTAFIFGVTAGGIKIDQVFLNDGQDEDPTWDPNWWVRTSKNDTGWVAEMRIPLSQLRFKKHGDAVWGLQVMRNIYRRREMSLWNHIPKEATGLVRHSGYLKGIENLEPRTIFDLTPYTVASFSTYPTVDGNPFKPGTDRFANVGLDAKIGLTNNFTLDLTLNPDFGQVEADPSEVNLTAFETFFEEKRPFFIEGRDISSFPIGIGDGGIGNDNLFYSRRIGRQPRGRISPATGAFTDVPSFTSIIGAAKVTGRTENGLSVALIQSVTAEEHAEIDLNGVRSFELVEPLTNFFIGRVRQDFNEGNTLLGGMVTSVNRQHSELLSAQMHSNAFSGGIDFTQFFGNRTWMFNVNAAMSHVTGSEAVILQSQRSSARYFQRPDADHLELDPMRTSLTGTGGRVHLGRIGGGHWGYGTVMLWKSPEFEINDLGYMREADQIISIAYAGFNQWNPKGIYRNYNINISAFNLLNFDGLSIVTGANINGFMSFENFWSAFGGIEVNSAITSTSHLRGGPALKIPGVASGWLGFGTDNRKKFVARLQTNLGFGAEDYHRNFRISPNFTFKPTDNLNLSLQPAYNSQFSELQYVRQATFNGQPRYLLGSFEQQVVSLSVRVNFTLRPGLTLQYWGQPFVAVGNYSDFKFITNPLAEQFRSRFHVFNENQIQFANQVFSVDEDINGTVDYSFSNPDFRFREFLSNLVVRWEYSPGSSVYLVWSQNRSGHDPNGNMDFFNDVGDLFTRKGTNIFLAKFTYRIGVR
ncbi:MAG TPA: DUF5916 domain-containing protein [Bacteroidales bacterium]|nr:DUF5916 domain-containing protein [Bacteroidales bacterium]